jgi:hypothetical protein
MNPDAFFDPSPYERLPALSVNAAAWIAGVTPEAFAHLLESSGRSCPDSIALLDLARSGFFLLAQKETQVAMLRLQLNAALEREKELVAALQAKIAFPAGAVPAAPVPMAPAAQAPAPAQAAPVAPAPAPARVNIAAVTESRSKKPANKKKK